MRRQHGQEARSCDRADPGSFTCRSFTKFCFVSFPTCQVRVVRFYQSCSPPPPPHPPPPSPLPPPPRGPDPSGHCRTSTASSRSQWALPDLNRDFQVAVGTAGPQPRLPDRSGHCRTSTANSRSQWALPDLNGQIECQKICQMECQIGCQKICQIECQKICQIECQKVCQIECQKICQIECQKIYQIECQKICRKICQNILEDMPDRMPEDMSDRMPEDLPVRKCINVMVGITRSKVIDYFVYPSTCLSVFLFVSLSYFAFLPRHFTMPSTSVYFGSSCMAQAQYFGISRGVKKP